MPVYEYQCQVCKKVKDVIHEISELTLPLPDTVKEITCHNTLMLVGFYTGEGPKVVTQDTRRKVNEMRKQRNENHKRNSVDEVFDLDARNHLKKKYSKKKK